VLNAWDAFIGITKDESYPIPSVPQLQFDEYEALIATCLHYSVRIGISQNMTPIHNSLTGFNFFTNNTSLSDSQSLRIDSQRVLITKLQLKLKGHTSLVARNRIYVIGGTNQGSVLQRRITRIQCTLSTTGGFNLSSELLTEAECFGRNYATAVFSESTDSILILGGRKSPAAGIQGDVIQIPNLRSSLSLTLETITPVPVRCCHPQLRSPLPRWRHATTTFNDANGDSHIFLFGGKTNGVNTLVKL